MVKINETKHVDADVARLESAGRHYVSEERVVDLRLAFKVSVKRFAEILGTARQVIVQWEKRPELGFKMRTNSAIRLGELVDEADRVQGALRDSGVTLAELVPMADVTTRLGLSPSSALIAEKCRTGALTCYDLGRFGFYIPEVQATALLHRGK